MMEEKKDFEKKQTVKLFGHEFDKKKAVMAGLGGLLALALAGGGIAWAVSSQPKDAEPAPKAEVQEEQEAYAIRIGAKAEGWVKGESSPVIAHIVNEAEGIDYYTAYDANEPKSLDVPAGGGYEVSFIAPVNKDGSTYKVPDAGAVEAEAVDEDAGGAGLPFTFEPVKAEDMDADGLSAIVSAVADAVKKGDETLTGENGVTVVNVIESNVKANANADEEKVEEATEKAAETAQSTPPASKPSASGGNGGSASGGTGNPSSKPSGGNGASGNSGSSSKPSGGSNPDSSGSGSKPSKPSHTHNWVAQTTTVHHEAEYKTVHHEAEYKTVHHDAVTKAVAVCNGCGAQFDTTSAWGSHSKSEILSGNKKCSSYHSSTVVIQQAYDEQVLVKDAWDEQVLVSGAWDETITTGYKCSGCGATK